MVPVTHGGLAAVVSQAPGPHVRPSRLNVRAHESVVHALHELGPALPVSFGTVLPDVDSVLAELLVPMAGDLERRLEDLDGKDEFRLKARYLPGVNLREAVERNGRIARLRARLAAHPLGGNHADKLALGQLVFNELQGIRASDAQAALDAATDYASQWRLLDERSDDVALYVALLVPRDRRSQLESALSSLADIEHTRMRFELTGPLAPWDFVDVPVGAKLWASSKGL